LTEHDFTQVKYWVELGIKAIIGVVVSIVGLDYRSVKNSLRELEENKYMLHAEVEVVKGEIRGIESRLERIEKKLDRALDK
jgi:hypothetical protein